MASFRLQSGNTDFNTRVDALFTSLQTAANELEPQLKREHQDEPEPDEEGLEDGRKRQCFIRPQGRPPQWRGRGGRRGLGPRNSTPDYIKNPERWTRYSMRDTQVLSDFENRQEGLKLLADLEERSDRNQVEGGQPMDCDLQPKIVFKKPSAPLAPAKAEDLEPVEVAEEPHHTEFDGSRKFKMPEYVVGKKKLKLKEKLSSDSKIISEKETVKKEVKLSYLTFEDDD